MTIQWPLFALVVVTALLASIVVTALYAGGIRLLSTPRAPVPSGTARDEEFDDVPRGRRPAGVTAAGAALFVLAGAVAVGGVLLVVVR